MFEKVNLEKELYQVRAAKSGVEVVDILGQFRNLFTTEWEREKNIRDVLERGCISEFLPGPAGLNQDRIFSLEHIRSLALKYRLRFLSTKHFSGEIPYDAILKIKEVENLKNQKLDSFMMLAPTSKFKLQDSNADPLLFAPLSDGNFYLLHQWGGDLHWSRTILAWPFKSLTNLVASIAGISLLLALILPTSWITTDTVGYLNFYRIAFLVWSIAFLSGMVSFFWFALNQQFSTHAWNSKYFN